MASINDSTNYTVQSCYSTSGTATEKTVKTLAYCVIALVGLVGNAVVLTVFRLKRELRTVVFCFIANMAITDLFLPLFAFPRALVEIYNGPKTWMIDGTLGALSCKMATLLQDISTAVSIQSLVLIAIERFVLLVYPEKKNFLRSAWSLRIVLLMTWASAIALHSPYLVIFQVVNFRNETYCIPEWSKEPSLNVSISKIYFVSIFTILYAIPFLILVVLYSTIVIRLKRYTSSGHNCAQKRRRQERNRAVTIMALIVVVAFFVCWTPFFVYAFVLCFVWYLRLPCGQVNFRFTVLLIAHFNSAVNPCIYLLCSKAFRQGVRAVLVPSFRKSS